MSERVIDDPFVERYQDRINRALATHLEDLEVELDVIVDAADAALAELSRQLAPSLYWYSSRRPEDIIQSRTRVEVARHRMVVQEYDSFVERCVITPGEFGPIPEELEPATIYKVRGVALGSPGAGCTLASASQHRTSNNLVTFSDADRITFFDGEELRYDGVGLSACDTCQTPEITYDSFTLMRPNGSAATDRDGWPQEFAAFRGMVAVEPVAA